MLNKKTRILSVAVLLLVFLLHGNTALFAQQVETYALSCELEDNPIGIDNRNPRLAWKINSSNRGLIQNGYRVIVASSEQLLNQGKGDVWDSGEVSSDQSTFVSYGGEPLKSQKKYYWKVKVFTNQGESNWSEVAHWKMGLLNYKDWSARWIGKDNFLATDDEATGRLSARYIRKEVSAKKEVEEAFVYIMGLGLYELYINGQKIGDQVLAPTPTDYTKNIKYNVFDVTEHIQAGDHALGVILGNGRFFAARQAKPYKVKSFGFPKMIMQLHIRYKDGSSEVIKTDNTWKFTSNGPITANNEYDGEVYDARKEMPGWAAVGFDDSQWEDVSYTQDPGGEYESQLNAPMRIMQELAVERVYEKGNGRYILDFGQNFSGWVKMAVNGNAGDSVRLRFAESLQDDGELFLDNLRDAKATDVYVLKDGGQQSWEPRFTYHGFRYVEVSNYPGKLDKKDFVGKFIYDDLKTIGSFTSSNELLNKIYNNAWWGLASNYKGMPVDCPQRNERQPWLGDRPISAYGETFMFANINFYTKWLEDIRLSQKEDGAISDVAPAFWRYYSDNMTWPGTYIIVAEMLYQQTGDISILKKHYPAMKKWIEYMESRYLSKDGILTKDSYGDWCFPPPSIEEGRGKIADRKYPSQLISTAYYYYLLNKLAFIAETLHLQEDVLEFQKKASVGKSAFNREFFNKQEHFYGENKMTENILAYYLDLVEEQHREALGKKIVENVLVDHNGHLATGVVGVQWIMRTLLEMGRNDLAYQLASNKTYPSWGYMIDQGATTIWELWNGNTAHPKMNSQNHVMLLGDLLIWMYENLAGIKADQPGFKQVVMRPEVVADLDHVQADFESLYGRISSNWKTNGKQFTWEIEVPANTKATVYIPAKSLEHIKESSKSVSQNKEIQVHEGYKSDGYIGLEIGSGKYSFESLMN